MNPSYLSGIRAALHKYALDDTSSAPYSLPYTVRSTSPEGRANMIDQAFNTNALLGMPDSELASAVNPALAGGAPPVGDDSLRRFDFQTDQSGGDL